MDPEKKLKQKNHVEAYYRDLLQLDPQKNSKNVLQVDSFVRDENNKFPWRMMLINMDDVRVLLEFFKKHVVNIKRGAKVLLERIEDYEGFSISEQPFDDAALIQSMIESGVDNLDDAGIQIVQDVDSVEHARRRSAVTSICHNSAASSHMSHTFQTEYFSQGGSTSAGV